MQCRVIGLGLKHINKVRVSAVIDQLGVLPNLQPLYCGWGSRRTLRRRFPEAGSGNGIFGFRRSGQPMCAGFGRGESESVCALGGGWLMW